MFKIIVFSRVSTEKQDLDQQTETLINYCKSIGYKDDEIYVIQVKESAIKLSEEERIGIQRLKEAVLKYKGIDTVICWEISRLSRRMEQIYSMRTFFIEHHTRWIVYYPYMELIDKEGKQSQNANLMMAIYSTFAENEMNLKKERAKRVYEYRKSIGKFAGGKILLGYKVDDEHNVQVDKETSELVKLIFNLYSTGEYSFRSLAKELKSRGYFENSSEHVIYGRISKYLHDERYIGKVFGWPQIINEELFWKCKDIASKQNIIQKPVNKREMLCKGLIFSKLRKISLIPEPAKHVYQTHPDYGKPSLTISSKYIDKLILDFTQEQIDKYLGDQKKIEEEYIKSQEVMLAKISNFTKQTYKIQEKLNRAEELYIDGGITKERLDRKTRDLKIELAEYRRNIADLDKEYSMKEQLFFNQKPVVLSEVSFEEKRKYVKQFISKIEIDKEKPLARRSKVYIHNIYDNKVYVYLLYSQNSKYQNKIKAPYLVQIEPEISA